MTAAQQVLELSFPDAKVQAAPLTTTLPRYILPTEHFTDMRATLHKAFSEILLSRTEVRSGALKLPHQNPTLTQPLPVALTIQAEIEKALEALRRQGLITSYVPGEVEARAFTFQVQVPTEHWTEERRGRLHDLALGLQERHGVVVMLDLRRDRQRALHP